MHWVGSPRTRTPFIAHVGGGGSMYLRTSTPFVQQGAVLSGGHGCREGVRKEGRWEEGDIQLGGMGLQQQEGRAKEGLVFENGRPHRGSNEGT